MAITQLGFGLLTCQRYPGETRSDADLYRHAIELAVEAERLGLDSVWTSEHHFFDDSYLGSQVPLLAAIAARTDRVTLGPCVLLAPLYDPIRLAEDVTALDLIAGGRTVLGLGLGWRSEELEAFGIASRDRVARLGGVVTILRQAWSDGLVTGDGATFRYSRLAVTPKPSRPGGPPIWIGAMVEAAVRRAARISDGFVATKVSSTTFAEQVGWCLDELATIGRDPATFTFAVHHPVFAWEGTDPWSRVAPSLHYVDWKYADMGAARSRRPPGVLPPGMTSSREASLRCASIVGSAREVAEGIREYGEAAGVDVHFIARSYLPGLPPDVQLETLRVLATDVMPLVVSDGSAPGPRRGHRAE
jgi:alkanesulfonate monooxygenase SsuD/methylene tetrahydromethanopterin reductase-like flavin-dependent oxidoreductase (luciferase family)